jgi:hypothetical protein
MDSHEIDACSFDFVSLADVVLLFGYAPWFAFHFMCFLIAQLPRPFHLFALSFNENLTFC